MLVCPYCARPLLDAARVEAASFRLRCPKRQCGHALELFAGSPPELTTVDYRPYRCKKARCMAPLFESNGTSGEVFIVCPDRRCGVAQTVRLRPSVQPVRPHTNGHASSTAARLAHPSP